MNLRNLAPIALAVAITAVLAGCNAGRDQADQQATTIEQNVETNVRSAMDEARRELETENISLNATGSPEAAITPKGDLLIDGKPVPINDEQRMLLLDYRTQLAGVASAGMDIGVQGAGLAAKAVGEALRGVFSGNPDQIEKRVEAQAEPIRQAALKLCDRLPDLYASQQKLAAVLPAFAPYAKMDQGDIDDCRTDAMDGKAPAAPTPPTAPSAPAAPVKDATAKQATATDVLGKPELPALPELPDPTG